MNKNKILGMLILGGLMMPGLVLAGSNDASGMKPYSLNRDLNAKHTPVISAPDTVKAGEPFEVTIKVGAKQHPSLVEHHVEWIQLYADETLIAHVQLTPSMTLPNIKLTVMLEHSADLKVVEAPNHSSGWVSKAKHIVVK